MIFYDTESIGFYGPTILIQWAKDDGDVSIHNIWQSRVQDTLDFIERMMDEGVVGFNLTHDSFHLNRTYGVLSMLPKLHKPDILDYRDCEQLDECHDAYCVKPTHALDLMLYGRKGEFQSTLNQKDIIIRKVPAVLANPLKDILMDRVTIPDIYFSKGRRGYEWKIVRRTLDGEEIAQNDTIDEGEVDQQFVNLKLQFNPSTALKAIIESITGKTVDTMDDLGGLSRPKEHGWNPCDGAWLDVAQEWLRHWTNDPRRLKYARNDVIYTRDVYNYFGKPELDDDDSILACAVGAIFWRGFAVDIPAAQNLLRTVEAKIAKAPINVNSSRQVKTYISEKMSGLEKVVLSSTKAEILESISKWSKTNPEVADRAQLVIDARRAYKEKDLLEKVITAGRLYVNFKVIGTKSNRMSGGSESYVSRGGSINPQGIKKGDAIRGIFPLAPSDMVLCGGDFDSFEISIAEAVWNDGNLRADLLAGKKFHALFGANLYNMKYEDVLATKDLSEQDPEGYYARAKRAVFANMYGGQLPKIASILGLDEEETYKGVMRHELRYPGVKESREAIYKNFAALKQPNGIGTEVMWDDPKEFVESFLGFRRYFKMEFSVVRTLFDIARKPPKEFVSLGKGIKLKRRDRIQTAGGAAASAVYAAAFNLCAKVMRAAANHEIQSPGGQITKKLEVEAWSVQPAGCREWVIMLLNIHDELLATCVPEVIDLVKEKVDTTVESFRPKIPLISMKWKTYLKDWSEK